MILKEICAVTARPAFIIEERNPNSKKKDELWKFIREENPYVYKKLRHGLMGHVLHLPGEGGRRVALAGYKVTRKIYGFN